MENLSIERLSEDNADRLAAAFLNEGLKDRRDRFNRYIREQIAGSRISLVAHIANEPVGYLNVIWESEYPPFRQDAVPEINDLDVLRSVRRRGVGSALMDEAEQIIGERSREAGIGVGMYIDYGPAQKMYVLRGYVPDGLGLTSASGPVRGGDSVVADDDLVLWFRKSLD